MLYTHTSVCDRAVCIFLCTCSCMKAVGMCCVHMCVTVCYVHIYGGCVCGVYMHRCVSEQCVCVVCMHVCWGLVSICLRLYGV